MNKIDVSGTVKGKIVFAVMLVFSGIMQAETDEKSSEFVGVIDPKRAEYNWVMHCRGCHGVDAKGSKGGAPNMVGEVALFLQSEEGRGFLGRVPGVAFVNLPDGDIAELLNWLTQTFDKPNVPEVFIPYSKKEVERLRNDPLISQAFIVRESILENIRAKEN